MTDHSFTPDTELASAAFDGEITSAERAQVDGSIELRAVIDSYSAIREQLATVTVQTPAREGALSAALAVFDELGATADNAGVVVPLHQRQQRFKRQQRWLAGAAAAVIVGVVAVAGTTGHSSNNNISAASNAASAAQSSSKVQAADSSALPSAISSIDKAAVVTVWATAANLATDHDLVAYMTDPNNVAAPSQPPPASASAGVTAGQTAPPTPAAPPALGVADINADCLRAVNAPYAAVIFKGAHGIAVRDDQTKSVRVLEPRTCAVLATIPLP